MSFALSKAVNPAKVFLTRKAEMTGRWDPSYFRPELVALEKRVCEATSHRLRDFVQQMSGGATPSIKDADTHYTESADGVPFIRVQNLSTTGRLYLEDCKRISRSTHEGLLARSKLFGGELLVKITGVGRMAVASVVPDGFEANINQHIVAIRTKGRKTSETLAAWLNLDSAERLASRRSTGGTRPALDYPALLSLPIVFDERLPTLIEDAVVKCQARLEKAQGLLGTIDDVLLAELSVIRKADPPNTIKKRIFQTDFHKITGQRFDPIFHQGDIFHFVREANCGLPRLGDLVAYFLTGFAAGRGDQSDEEGAIIQIRPTNLSNDRELVFNRNVTIAAAELKMRTFDALKRGEVLFNNTNSQEQVGKTVYFDLNGDYFSSNHITRIAPKGDQLNAQYLSYVLNLYQRQKVFFKLCTNWNNQSGVGVDVLEKIPIPLPNPKRQALIAAKLEKIRDEARMLRLQAVEDLQQAKAEIEALILGKKVVE
ncbi:MAG: restriction endonuclease subunit S [Proteobacteria bacterium]|nr:restriction endonuclease subunit S [Pseudomonadota bacterium]